MQSTFVKLLIYPIRLEVDISLQVIWLKISLMLSAGSGNKTTATEVQKVETHSWERKERCMLGNLAKRRKRWQLTEKHGNAVKALYHKLFGQVWSKLHNAAILLQVSSLYVAECNLGKVKLKQMLSAVLCSGHMRGFAFICFVAGAFGLCSSHIFIRCLPALLAIAECLFVPTPPTLFCLWVGKYFHWFISVTDCRVVAALMLGLHHARLYLNQGTFPKLIYWQWV